ncbi:MAG: cytochrome P450, partial [Candidatus Entotheonellia bacterium]
WAWLKHDPAGRTVRATEECLRYDAPVKSIQRIASQDVDMHGKLLRTSDRIRWFISSANRDPKTFAEPSTFNISRYPNPHVAFGSGIHHCLGATIVEDAETGERLFP